MGWGGTDIGTVEPEIFSSDLTDGRAVTSDLPPEADVVERCRHVSSVPQADIHSIRAYFLRLYFPTALTIWDQMRLHFPPAFLVYLFRDGLRRSAVYFALIPLTTLTIMV
jgi:hypothetical protein